MKSVLAVFFALGFSSVAFSAELKEFTYSTSQPWEFHRSLYGEKSAKPLKGFRSHMLEARKGVLSGAFKTCLSRLNQAQAYGKIVENWIQTEKLHCQLRQLQKDRTGSWRAANSLLSRTAQDWDRSGPHQKSFRQHWQKLALLTLQVASQQSRREAWDVFFLLQPKMDDMADSEKADVYFIAGRLASQDKKNEIALEYFERSVSYRKTKAAESQIVALRSTLKLPDLPELTVDEEVGTAKLTPSAKELELLKKFEASESRKDYLAAIEDGVRLLNDFPQSGEASRVLGRLRSVYLFLASRNDDKLRLLKEDAHKEIRKLSPENIHSIATLLFDRELFSQTVSLSMGVTDKLEKSEIRSKTLMLIGTSFLHMAEFSSAADIFKLVQKEFPGTEAGAVATFRLGLMMYRLKEYSTAAVEFEKYLANGAEETYRVSCLYWLYRAKQKLGSPTLTEDRDRLINEFPLSYFALRLQAEANEGKLDFKADSKDGFQVRLWLTPSEEESWQRARVLIEANWFEEAHAELNALPSPQDVQGLLAMAHLWSGALNYHQATLIAARAWALDRQSLNQASLRIVYPKEFLDFVRPQANRYKLPENLVFSLIRQESQFRPWVESPAGALGLMQVLRGTGREVARDLKVRPFTADLDLRRADLSVRLGTNYLYRMVRAFDGHVPLALAAYNAGIGNIRAWLSSRRDLTSDQMSMTDPDSEIWMDELPWLETTGYVRNILRNWMIYRVLDESAEKFSFPIWSDSP